MYRCLTECIFVCHNLSMHLAAHAALGSIGSFALTLEEESISEDRDPVTLPLIRVQGRESDGIGKKKVKNKQIR